MLDAAGRTALAEHAQSCVPCGRRLREQEELQTTLSSLFEGKRFRPELAADMAERLYHEQYGTSLNVAAISPPVAPGTPPHASPVLLLLVGAAGALLGYMAAGGRSSNATEMLTLAAFADSGPHGLSMLAALGGAGFADIGRSLFLLFALAWVTRSSVWNVVFPAKLPNGLIYARIFAVPVLLVGFLRLVINTLATVGMLGGRMGFGRSFSGLRDELQLIFMLRSVFDLLWTVGFWIAVFILLFTLVNHGVVQFARQAERARR
jgi:hypothetical protein